MAREGKAPILTPAQIRKVFKMAKITSHNLRNIGILHASFSLGLRACEIRRLRICDVLQADGVQLVDTINLLKTMTKGAKQRDIPFTNPKARAAISKYLKERFKDRPETKMTDPLFLSQKGGAFSFTGMDKTLKGMYRAAGYEHAKSHTGRRTCITMNYRLHGDIRAMQIFAGHESITTTQRYIDHDPERLNKICEKSYF